MLFAGESHTVAGMTPGERIKATRDARDITQQKLAVLADVSYRTVHEAENGSVKRSTMRKLYDALGLDPSELYEEEVAS